MWVFACCALPVIAQPFMVKGVVREFFSNEPLPFALLTINNGEQQLFTNIEGEFQLQHVRPIVSIKADTPLHRDKTLTLKMGDRGDSLLFYLVLNRKFQYVKDTDPVTYQFMETVVAAKKQHNPEFDGNFRFKAYNKFYLTTERTEISKQQLSKLGERINKIKFLGNELQNLSDAHHLLLMETVTEKEFHTPMDHKEEVLASKVSGIQHSSMFAATSLLQPFSIYQNYVQLTGTKHYSPFLGHAFGWYRFHMVDSAMVNGEKVYVVQFNPKSTRKIEFLKGYLFINANNHSVQHVIAWPSVMGTVETDLYQTYQESSDGRWFPKKTVTKIIKDRYTSHATKFEAVNETILFDIETDSTFTARDFDEVVMDFRHDKEKEKDKFWELHRQIPLSVKDRNTYQLFDSIGGIPNFERLIRLGEGLYYGEIPYKWVNMHLYDVYRINQHEGLRIGLGLHTNDRFSPFWGVGGHVAYGTLDKEWKYLLSTHVKLSLEPEIDLELVRKDDKYESGRVDFFQETRQFSTENLRNVLVDKMDRVVANEVAIEARNIFRYLSARVSFSKQYVVPQFDYTFQDRGGPYSFSEVGVALNYAYGEHFIQSLHRKISLGTHFPLVWFQWQRGLQQAGGDFRYNRFDFRIQESFKLASIGTTHLRVDAGYISGKVPYTKLYTGRGSHRQYSAVTHNSFETMNYNEFLSDRYVSLFFSHDFGKMYVRKFKSQPFIQVMHNMGWGSLRNPQDHGFSFSTMEKGFFEVGGYINNLLVIKMLGFELGAGIGAFQRYGYYANPDVSKNVLLKFAVQAQL